MITQLNTNNILLIFNHLSPKYIISSRQILAQIKLQECIGHIKLHFMTTSPVTYVINGIQDVVKYCIYQIKLFGSLHPDKTITKNVMSALLPISLPRL